ncbi:hypothetical protein JRQ81_014063 [Phrynocephalus forsythii]|uniref:Uncharacterized protein n=1 Tax=Phrynocephalus forsythii TaxID=171643 RepID=A0A9Q0XYL4_9SAUR|nr:hypothetical protein JRQ81_014063 [Phrynocephalus forsythii]
MSSRRVRVVATGGRAAELAGVSFLAQNRKCPKRAERSVRFVSSSLPPPLRTPWSRALEGGAGAGAPEEHASRSPRRRSANSK